MINPIITQGYIFNNPGSFIVSQGFGLTDGGYSEPVTPVEPVVVVDTGEIAEYINQADTNIKNSRAVVGYQKRGYGVLSRGNKTNTKSIVNTRLSSQFGLAFDRFYLDYAGQKEDIGQ